MNRTAAEILNDMENRIARLERQAARTAATVKSAEDLASDIKALVKKYFPLGVVSVRAQESLGSKRGETPMKDILIRMTATPKEEWKSGIDMNDPFYTQIWVWDAEGTPKTELSVGGVIRIGGERKKVPFRSSSGSQEKVLKGLESFLSKAAAEWSALRP